MRNSGLTCLVIVCYGLCLLTGPKQVMSKHCNAAETTAYIAPGVDPRDAIDLHRRIARWVTDWQTPEVDALPYGSVGLWVGIRLSGKLMGDAADMQFALQPDKALTSIHVVTGTVRRAMARAETRSRGNGNAVDQIEQFDRMRDGPLSVELQLATTPTRLRVKRASEIALQTRPGIDGLMFRRGGSDSPITAFFPGKMLAEAQIPRTTIDRYLRDQGMSEVEFEDELTEGTTRVWTFEVIHLAQSALKQPPQFLFRGSRLVSQSSISKSSIEAFAIELTDHLITRLWPGEEPFGLMGTYIADIDRYKPLVAKNDEQALAAFALLKLSQSDSFKPEVQNRAQVAAMTILENIAVMTGIEDDPARDLSTAAMIVIATKTLDNSNSDLSDTLKNLIARCNARVQQTVDADGTFRVNLGAAERAAIAYAIGSREVVNATWQATTYEVLPSLFPWLGWAEIELADTEEDGNLVSAIGLRGLRTRLWDSQVDFVPGIEVDEDEIGGLAFRGSQSLDWHASRPLSFIATMLGDPRLTKPEERSSEIVKLVKSIRFLQQLSMRNADRYRLPNPDRALGGIRINLWSDRMPISASAMTLLTLIETVESLDRIASETSTTAQ